MEAASHAARRELLGFESVTCLQAWSAIDDVVMGGVSRSALRHDPSGFAVFEGVVSLTRGGGFASIRCRPAALGAPGASAYLLEAQGDGKRYKLNLRLDEHFDGINFQASFQPAAGVWSLVRVALGDFAAKFRGRALPDVPRLDPARVRQIGLMIAERQAGPFALALRSIQVE